MRVFVTGATGFIGSAVVWELLEAGHAVTGLARSDASASALTALGARAHRGSLDDLASLRRGAAAADAAVHLAFNHEITDAPLPTRLRIILGGAPSGIVGRFVANAVAVDRRAIETIGQALRGSDRALAVAFGTLGLTPGRIVTEDDAPDPKAVGGPRAASESILNELAASGVRTSAVRLPPIVHGDDDRAGLTPRIIAAARKFGNSAYVGDGENRWPAVHVRDAARLFRVALESGGAGSRFHGVAEEGIPFRTIAELVGRRLGIPTTRIAGRDAAKHFGWLAPFVGADNPVSSAATQRILGWQPTHRGALADIDDARYFAIREKSAR